MKWFLLILLSALSVFPVSGAEVVPRGRYRFEFEAQASGRICPADWSMLGVKADYPEVELLFRNAAGKRISAGRISSRFRIFHSGPVSGTLEFYAPSGAVCAELAGRGAKILRERLVPAGNPESTIHIPLRMERPMILPNVEISRLGTGSFLYDASAGAIDGDPIPVEPGERLRLTVDGASGSRREGLVIRTSFFLPDGRTFLKRNAEPLRISGKRKQFVYEFIVPPKAGWLRIWLMWGIVYDYKVEKIKSGEKL